MIRIFLSSILSIIFFLNLPASPTYTNTDWSNSGATIPTLSNAKTISILDFGGKADNNTDNSIALQNAIKSAEGKPTIINIPSGNYTFKKTINIPSNIILKGAGSLICKGTNIAICTLGNPGMATAGMGDVLAGITAGLVSQDINTFDASCTSVYLHAKAGDIQAQKNGERGLLATDILLEIRRLLNFA